MRRILILYGTREGHTSRIARYVGAVAREGGYDTAVQDCKDLPQEFELKDYDGVVVAAPVHDRKPEGSIVDFIRQHRAALERIPAAFLSVGLVPLLPRFLRPKASAGAMATLLEETGWEPSNALMVGGAVKYRVYPPRQRMIFRIFMALLGGPTDTSRDHDLTDWASLRRFTQDFLATLRQPEEAEPPLEAVAAEDKKEES